MFDKYLTKTGLLSIKQPQEVKNQWYIKKFQEVHGDRYDYSGVEYKTTREKVEILCKEHGSFFQRPNDHLQGVGCPKCQYTSKQKTAQQCTGDFKQVHGNTYDYSQVVYINDATKVEIICKEHGSFYQRPGSHLEGKGCPKCQVSNQTIVYVLKCQNTGLYKIGITNNLSTRIRSIGGNLEHIYHITTENPRDLEKYLHQRYQDYNIFNPHVNNGGTEFFQLSEPQVEELLCFLSQHQDQ